MRGHAWLAPGLIGAMVLVATWMVIAHSAFPADHDLHISAFWMTLLGKFLCFAMLALAMDLIWGYTGILSLGQGLFFALGGYLFGMYLMRQIGRDGVYQSDLPDFMVFLDWKALPWYWSLSDSFAATLVLIVVVPGLIAAVFGYLAFRSRIKGVYFSIMTQALTYAVMLAFFRNDMGFGGNNGFTDFKRILGYPIAEPFMRSLLLALSALAPGSKLSLLSLHCQFKSRSSAYGDSRIRGKTSVYRLSKHSFQALCLGSCSNHQRDCRSLVCASSRDYQSE